MLILRGEFRAGAGDDAGGAAGADVERGGQVVRVVVRPFAAAAAPAVVGTADAVIHAGGAIPWAADVPLHVGIVGEELALIIEADIELVAEAVAEEFEAGAIGVHAANVAAGGEDAAGVAICIPQAREDVVFIPNFRRTAVGEAFGEFGVVAAVEVDAFAIGADDHAVQAVLAAAGHGVELGDLVVLIVAIGVLEAVEAVVFAVFIHHDVEAVESGEQAVRFAEFDGEFFGFEVLGLADGRNAHAVDAAVLVAGDEASFGIDGEGDPGAFLVLRHIVELLDLEAFRHGHVSRRDRFGGAAVFAAAAADFAIEGLAPRSLAVFLDDEGFFEFLRACFGGLPTAIRLDDDVLAAGGQFQRESGDHRRDAALVGRVDDEFVALATLDVLAEVSFGRLLPIGIGEDLLAVEAGSGAVVAGELERGELRILRHIELVPEGDLVVFVAVFGEPNPLRGGVER